MWIILGVILAVITYLIYIYGVFKPMKLYSDSLTNPIFLYFSWKGNKKDLGAPFDVI